MRRRERIEYGDLGFVAERAFSNDSVDAPGAAAPPDAPEPGQAGFSAGSPTSIGFSPGSWLHSSQPPS